MASVLLDKYFDLPCHVYLKDTKGIYLGSNDYHAHTGGVQGSDFIGQSDFDIHAHECAATFQSYDRRVIQKNTPLSLLEDVIFNDNFNRAKKFIAFTFKQPLHNQRNKVIGVLGLTFTLDQVNAFSNLIEKIVPINHLLNKVNSQEDPRLTQRQADILFHLVQGKTAKHIADIFNLSYRTVEHHISAIKNKYHCSSRSELISYALKLNFIKERLV